MFKILSLSKKSGYVLNLYKSVLRAKIKLLERMSNSKKKKIGTGLTRASWMAKLHIKGQKQLPIQVKQFFDIKFYTYISNVAKNSIL